MQSHWACSVLPRQSSCSAMTVSASLTSLSGHILMIAFGLYVNRFVCTSRRCVSNSTDIRHGEPNRDCQAIEWEGRPDSVAFHPPYLLLCSAPFIEIRHIDTAKLIQIYTGRELRITWE